jgi:hypothetical protein
MPQHVIEDLEKGTYCDSVTHDVENFVVSSRKIMHRTLPPETVRKETYAIGTNEKNKNTLFRQTAFKGFNATARIYREMGTALLIYFPYNARYKLTSNLPLNDVGLEGSHFLPLLEGAVRLKPAVHQHDIVPLVVWRGIDGGRLDPVPKVGLLAGLDPVLKESLDVLIVVIVA